MTKNDITSEHAYLTTAEVAEYLRLGERKIYDLVRQEAMPCVKITGKLLFPRQAIDLWLMNHLEGDQQASQPVPQVLAGSHDPLLDWSVRESRADLATLIQGSGDGVKRLLRGEAMVAGLHLLEPRTGEYNHPQQLGLGGMRDLVILHWARRRQGLLLRPESAGKLKSMADLTRARVRVAQRQPEAGAYILFKWLLSREGIDDKHLCLSDHPYLSEEDLALAVREGVVDTGLAVEAVARRHQLKFIPLHEESFDLAMRRRSYFEPAVQRLMAFARTARFIERAASIGGYDVSAAGQVKYNA